MVLESYDGAREELAVTVYSVALLNESVTRNYTPCGMTTLHWQSTVTVNSSFVGAYVLAFNLASGDIDARHATQESTLHDQAGALDNTGAVHYFIACCRNRS